MIIWQLYELLISLYHVFLNYKKDISDFTCLIDLTTEQNELVYFDCGLLLLKTVPFSLTIRLKNCPLCNQERPQNMKAVHCHAPNAS